MLLYEYIKDTLDNNILPSSFPDKLEVSKKFVDVCYSLFTTGESRNIELGVCLKISNNDYDVDGRQIDGAKNGTGITLPKHRGNEFFGDIHCHPADSIGHKKGYAAHSPEDVTSMEHHTHKPVFIRFVCSGTKIYAMVFRGGHSKLQPQKVQGIGSNNDERMRKYLDNRCRLNREQRNEFIMNNNPGNLTNLRNRELRLMTPGYGAEAERVSVEGALAMAKECKMGFFVGDQGYGVSSYFNNGIDLERVVP